MSAALEAEIVPPGGEEPPRVRLQGVRMLGVFGTVMALLTMLAAFGIGFLAFFGRTLAAALILTVVWPLVFSADFTQWVFGSPGAPFWKLFLLFLAAGAVLRLFGRPLWRRK